MTKVHLSNAESFQIWMAAKNHLDNIKKLPQEERKILLVALENMKTRSIEDGEKLNSTNDSILETANRVIKHLNRSEDIEKTSTKAERLFKKIKKVVGKHLRVKDLKGEIQKIANSKENFIKNSQFLKLNANTIRETENGVALLKQVGSNLINEIEGLEKKIKDEKRVMSRLERMFGKETITAITLKKKKEILKQTTIDFKKKLKLLKELKRNQKKVGDIVEKEKGKLVHAPEDLFTSVEDVWDTKMTDEERLKF